jgi:hypothetical protein
MLSGNESPIAARWSPLVDMSSSSISSNKSIVSNCNSSQSWKESSDVMLCSVAQPSIAWTMVSAVMRPGIVSHAPHGLQALAEPWPLYSVVELVYLAAIAFRWSCWSSPPPVVGALLSGRESF